MQQRVKDRPGKAERPSSALAFGSDHYRKTGFNNDRVRALILVILMHVFWIVDSDGISRKSDFHIIRLCGSIGWRFRTGPTVQYFERGHVRKPVFHVESVTCIPGYAAYTDF